MPLSQSAPRQSVHTRQVICQGYRRDDGLWDIEGHMTDVKPFHFPNEDRGGYINAGEPLHGMSIRITIDHDLLISEAEAVIDYSPFHICPEIAQRFQALVGLSIQSGWNQKVRQLFSGINGCTHLLELLGPMATTAIQVMFSQKVREAESTDKQSTGAGRPLLLNSCHAFSEHSVIVKRHWPEHYTASN